jgi:hypothetical protein
MSAFTQVLIGGYPGGGLTTDRKPMMLANEAFSRLENAYVWRERTKKRDGQVSMGQLQRNIPESSFFPTTASPFTINILTISGLISGANNANPGQITTFLPHNLVTGDQVILSNVGGATGYNNVTFTITVLTPTTFTVGVNAAAFGLYTSGGIFLSNRSLLTIEPNASIVPGSVVYTILAGTTRIFTDDGQGNLISNFSPGSNFGTINYVTGAITITTNAGFPRDTLLLYSYYPGLPVMGICKQDVPAVGIDQTIFFDTKYAYQFVSGAFQELASTTPTIWTGTNTDFFWSTNYQGADPSVRYFFETNNNITAGASTPYDPIRYYNNSTWTDLVPIIADTPESAAQSKLFQALIVIPYYGRLLALNTWEGLTSGGVAGATNFFARARFSQIGNPTAVDAWRSDQFGKGGFLDAPTNESIVSVAFFRNTLIVFFEYSTWQLRYLGEYGLPFIFERISSDFGSVSTFSPIIFDQGVMAVSDRGIIQAGAGEVRRLDDQIPETVFSFEIQNKSPNFVHGIRDFEKEVVYWNYIDASDKGNFQTYPNTSLLFNYRNNTWAQFRDTITCFGVTQFQFGINWDSTTTYWNSESVTWDNADDQQYSEYVTAGNQQGFVFIYENQNAETPVPAFTLYAPLLFISAINNAVSPARLTVPSHNLVNEEIIYITGALWSGTDPGINNTIYNVTVIDANTISLGLWNGMSYTAVDIDSAPTYIGGGYIALFPVMNIVGKDFNPFQAKGKQFKLSSIDFQMDADNSIPSIPAVTVQLFVNSYLGEQANFVVGNQELINSALDSGIITGATNANPCLITSPDHSLATGTLIYIANVLGMTQLNAANYTITVVDANHFTLDGINSTGFGTYTGGGIWNALPIDGTNYQSGSQYAWYSFYSTQFGQYLRVALTYDDVLMNQIATHQSSVELNAMNLWFREGGRLTN